MTSDSVEVTIPTEGHHFSTSRGLAKEEDHVKAATIRACGISVAGGAVAWAIAGVIVGPLGENEHSALELWGSGLFQVGLVCMIVTMRGTDATGTSRWGRVVLGIEMLLLAPAIAWTIPFLIDADRPHEGILVVLDAFWPLSIVWLIPVGITVAKARRWPTPVRWLPFVASLLIPVDIAASFAGEQAALVIGSTYMAVTYGTLGLLIVRDVAPLASYGPSSPQEIRSGVGGVEPG